MLRINNVKGGLSFGKPEAIVRNGKTLSEIGKVKMTDQGEIIDSWELKSLSEVKEGDFFRLSENGSVYIREDYERSLGKYRVTKAEYMNAETFKKGSVIVQVGFDY